MAKPRGIQLAFTGALPPDLQGVMPTTRINEFLAAMVEESDRGLVIGIISIADQLMEARLEKMFNQGNARARESVERAFGSFGGRVNALYALGLISYETYRDLEMLRKVRNEAAHDWPAFRLDAVRQATFVDPCSEIG